MEKELDGSRDANVTKQLCQIRSLIDKIFKLANPDCELPSMNLQPCKFSQ
jgi:hypothetical protein